MSRWLIIIGLCLVVAGIGWPLLARLGLGHLPGDIHIERDGWSFHFPIVTCIVLSVAVSLLLWLFRK